jgi:hypothetical protein
MKMHHTSNIQHNHPSFNFQKQHMATRPKQASTGAHPKMAGCWVLHAGFHTSTHRHAPGRLLACWGNMPARQHATAGALALTPAMASELNSELTGHAEAKADTNSVDGCSSFSGSIPIQFTG